MRKAITTLARLLDRVQHRFQRSRAGSVMILVVTLLVLMAIIGTAFLTTARNDRYSSQLHESNVQVDMLLDGVKNIIIGRMVQEDFLEPNGQRWDDVHSDNWLASRTPTYMIDACGVWDSGRVYNRGDWVQVTSTNPISFYVCTVDGTFGTNNDPSKGSANWMVDPEARPNTPCWEAVSSLFDLVPGVGNSAEDVRGSAGSGGFPPTFDGTRGRNLVQLVYSNGLSASVQSNGQYYPALRFYSPANPNATPPTVDTFQVALAASASGNGIADSFLWRLPMGEINGVTYYAAVRVIDNNSAINLNTAGSSLYDFDAYGNPLPNMSFFPGDVGLAELLSTFNVNGFSINGSTTTLGPEYNALNQYRDTGLLNYTNGNNVPLPDGIIGTLNPTNLAGPTMPLWDSQGTWGTRPDFRYLSVADAQFMGLGRRIDLPGYSLQRSGGGTPLQFNNFSWGDSAALAYKFDLVSPATLQSASGAGGGSNAETVLAPSLWRQNYYTSTPWDPSSANQPYTQTWFNQNYAYTTPNLNSKNGGNGDVITGALTFTPLSDLSNTYNRRPLVVARNPQSNMMPVHAPEMDALGSWAPYITTAMGYNYNSSQLDPSRANMPRASLNTASPLLSSFRTYSTDYPYATDVPNPSNPSTAPLHIPTLWLAFYNAMLPALEPPYTDFNLFYGLNFKPPGNITSTTFFKPSGQPLQLAQQFRSSLRDPSGIGPYIPNRQPQAGASTADPDATTWLPPASELLLRSLIAAVNTQDIRDSDDDVSSATLLGFPVMSSGAMMDGGAKLTVFGTERQPFITEIYVNNDTTVQPGNFTGPGGVNIPNNVSANMANPVPYVAVELYNPYDVPIPLNGWALGAVNRTSATFPHMTIRQIGTATTFTGTPVPTVPPRGFLVLESVDVAHTANTYRPWWVYPNTKVNNDANAAATDRTSGNYCFVSGLDTILTDPTSGTGDELYLLRPRLASGAASQSVQTQGFAQGGAFNETNLADMVPVDSFDFFGMNRSPDGSTFQAWHYVRANSIWTDANPTPPNTQINPPRPSWKFVFAGHWEPGLLASTVTGVTVAPAPQPPLPPTTTTVREEGVATGGPWTTGAIDPWIAAPPGYVAGGTTAQPTDGPTAPINMGSADYASSYTNPYPGIPLNYTGYGVTGESTGHGINKNVSTNSFDSYPFGGYARNGDLLQTPFIGGYTITYNGAIVEMNPVTKDAGFADDNNLNYVYNITSPPPPVNPVKNTILRLPAPRTIAPNTWYPAGTTIQFEDDEEQVGRFVPLSSADGDPRNFLPVYSTGDPKKTFFPAKSWYNYNIPWTDGTNTETRLFDTYGWASGVFDYFSTLQAPNDDYLPNTKQEYYYPYNTTSAGYVTTGLSNWNTSVPVANSPAGTSSPNGNVEATAPIEGLININTAPWRVLAQLPFYCPNPRTTGAGEAANLQMLTANISIAQAIVRYREQFGPFHSIFELNRVYDPYLAAAYDPTKSQIFQNQDGLPGFGPPDSTDYESYQGVLTPNLPGFLNDGGVNPQTNQPDPNHLPDGLITDFNQREAEVMRLSNLLTTRSDSFTIYIQVQGWRGAGTPGAQLVVQRRAAFIMDRSGSTRSVDVNANTSNQIEVNIPTNIQTQ